MVERQSPIFSKTYDLLLWLLNHTEHFPKSERFRMGKRMEDSAFTFYEKLIEASRRQSKHEILANADLELIKLRLYLRISHTRKLTTTDQYEYASKALGEIGKLLGGWIKTLPANP